MFLKINFKWMLDDGKCNIWNENAQLNIQYWPIHSYLNLPSQLTMCSKTLSLIKSGS